MEMYRFTRRDRTAVSIVGHSIGFPAMTALASDPHAPSRLMRPLVIALALLLAVSSDGVAQGAYDPPESRVVRVIGIKPAKEGVGHGYWLPAVMPVYPAQLSRARINGFAEVRAVVGEDGRVKSAIPLQSSHNEFEGPALLAVRTWRFAEIANPITKKRVGTTVDIRFEFSIRED